MGGGPEVAGNGRHCAAHAQGSQAPRMEALLKPRPVEEQSEYAAQGGNAAREVRAVDRERGTDRAVARSPGAGRIHSAGSGWGRFDRETGAAAARSGSVGAGSRSTRRGVVPAALRKEGIGVAGGRRDARSAVLRAHRHWRAQRKLEPSLGFPGLRYVLLHSLSHALIRQFSVECGYAAASLKERIYSSTPDDEEAMAGILIYTAAPDSEGTLGGLVTLGETANLEQHLDQALEGLEICSSDPLCAETQPEQAFLSLHGAACHNCLFLPETSCERGNRYLDRTVLVPTMERAEFAFFRP